MKHLKNSIGTRLIIIAALSVILLVPSIMIQEVISDREERRDSVIEEISEKWGEAQIITGPVLTIPYKHYLSDNEVGEYIKRYAHFLPASLDIEGSIYPEIRYRGIYEAVLYNSQISFAGNFNALGSEELGIPESDYLYNEAVVSVGITDMTGIKEAISITWDSREYEAEPGIESTDLLHSGISISTDIEVGINYTFTFDLNLNGSSELRFVPAGEETTVQLESDWQNPSFAGSFLPTDRVIEEGGFRSTWNVLNLNRNFPQKWIGPNKEIENSAFGVELLLPIDEYQKTMRTAKYAIMFIGLTFLTFFMIELLSDNIIHPVHYLLIGFALLVFYTLLLSISEYVLFGLAYLIASSAIIGLITIYSFVVLSDGKKAVIVFGVLSLLYSYLYVLLQLQDYALLMGSIGLFVVLSIVMYLTCQINWFEIMGSNENDVPVKSIVHPSQL